MRPSAMATPVQLHISRAAHPDKDIREAQRFFGNLYACPHIKSNRRISGQVNDILERINFVSWRYKLCMWSLGLEKTQYVE